MPDGDKKTTDQTQNRPDGPDHVNSTIDQEAVQEDFDWANDANGDGRPEAELNFNNTCDGYLCNTANYEIISQQNDGNIALGVFVHIPQNATQSQENAFANGMASAFGPGGDPDGDGLANHYDPNPGQTRGGRRRR